MNGILYSLQIIRCDQAKRKIFCILKCTFFIAHKRNIVTREHWGIGKNKFVIMVNQMVVLSF